VSSAPDRKTRQIGIFIINPSWQSADICRQRRKQIKLFLPDVFPCPGLVFPFLTSGASNAGSPNPGNSIVALSL
jgi:hypothetical protein